MDDTLERKALADELRKEVDKIRYQWSPPVCISTESLRKIIRLIRGEYVYLPEE